MSIKTDNYIRFFQDQVTEIQREYNKTKAVPMKQLFRDEIITLATIDSVNHTNGHVVIKVKKGFAPRLKVMKNITLVTKHAKDVLGTIANWNLSFDEFNRTCSFHVGLSDIVPLYFIKKADVEYDYIGCSYVSLSLFSNIDNALRSGKTVTGLLFDPFPPTEYFNNLAFYTKQNEADIYLDIEPKISYDEWTPEELAYDENNPYGIVDKIYNTLSEESCCIVQGPPGTGKSFTIAHIISRYLEQGKCVCVTTMANKGLIELAKQPPLAKYLETSKVYKTRLAADEAKQVPGLQPASKDLCVPAGSVVLATNYILSGLFNSNRDPSLLQPSYDLIVIEEASQVFLSAIAAFKSIGKHCLIVGDPMQLPPIVLGADKIQYKLWKVQQQCDGLSSFALGTDIKSYRITTTFRLTPRSASQTALFYGESFRSVQKERLDFGEIQSPYFPKEGGCILAYSQSGTDSVCSKGALSIMHYVVDQISHFYPEREVAIITPFKDTIKLLQKEFYTENQQLDITVETIDRIQGMTVDYAIVYFPMCNISFALSENRFNVATSRSRSTTLIISDLDFKALSSVPRKSLRFLDTCEMYGADSVKPVGKPIASEAPKSQTESATVISSGDMSVKVLGSIDLSKFERKKMEIVEGKQNLYIIDTNVFVNCPEIISKIDKKYPIVLSAKVIDELDKLKIKLDTAGVQNVQKALKSINYQMTQRDVRMELSDPSLLPSDFDRRSPDNMILTVALKYKGSNPILLTSDNGLQIKARGLGITTISLKEILKK